MFEGLFLMLLALCELSCFLWTGFQDIWDDGTLCRRKLCLEVIFFDDVEHPRVVFFSFWTCFRDIWGDGKLLQGKLCLEALFLMLLSFCESSDLFWTFFQDIWDDGIL